jgi:HAD superfamily phosphoserine phosphatase-like hydrolase
MENQGESVLGSGDAIHAQGKIRRIALFDFDGTLTPTNCIYYFVIIKFFYLGPVSRWFWLMRFMLQVPIYYLLDKYSAKHFNRYFYSKFSGMDYARISEIIESRVTPYLRCQLFIQAEQEIQQRLQQGYEVVVVSGSWHDVVFPVVSGLGVSDCLATQLEVNDGRLTGRADIVADDSKAVLMKHYANYKGADLQNAIAYGNSRWDIAMLNSVKQAFTINPDKGLRRWADKNNAELLVWLRPSLPRRAYWMGPLIMPFMRAIKGLEHLPKQGGVLIIANHSSYLDHFCLSTITACFLRRDARFVAKKEHFISPFSRWFLSALGAYPIDREHGGKDALKKTVELLRRGELVIIYPEGTRTLTGEMGHFLPGVLHIERQAQCPIVPLGISGAFDVWPKHCRLPRLGRRVGIHFDSPVLPKELHGITAVSVKKAREKKLDLLRERVACLIQ